jgi:hypothetical protein
MFALGWYVAGKAIKQCGGQEWSFVLRGILNYHFTFWVADIYVREVDDRAVGFAKWIVEKTLL